MLNEVYASIEEGMFNMDAASGKPEIFLRPKESVNVPFKFVTFKADEKVQLQVRLMNDNYFCDIWSRLFFIWSRCRCAYLLILGSILEC